MIWRETVSYGAHDQSLYLEYDLVVLDWVFPTRTTSSLATLVFVVLPVVRLVTIALRAKPDLSLHMFVLIEYKRRLLYLLRFSALALCPCCGGQKMEASLV